MKKENAVIISRLGDKLAPTFAAPIQRQKFEKTLLAAMINNAKLAKVLNTPKGQASLFIAAEKSRALGLDVGIHCHLVPYGETAQLVVGYQGAVQMLSRSNITLYRPVVVHENDDFDYGQGMENGKIRDYVRYQPALRDRGAVRCGFIRWEDANGKADFLVMSLAEIQERRKKANVKNPLMDKFPGALVAKTLIFEAAKYLPVGSEDKEILALSANVIESQDEIPQNPILDAKLKSEAKTPGKTAASAEATPEGAPAAPPPAPQQENAAQGEGAASQGGGENSGEGDNFSWGDD